jgi:CRP-like cAMP-binding protein
MGMIEELRERIHGVRIFSSLQDREVETLLSLGHLHRFRRRTVIFDHRDPGDAIYVILDGTISVSRCTRSGREVAFIELGPGAFVGEMSLFDGQPRSATATALTDARLLAVDRKTFMERVLPMTGVVPSLLAELSKRLRAADRCIEQLACATLPERLVHLLGHLARRHPPEGGVYRVRKAPSRQRIADLLGSTRESVCRSLAAMEEGGLIESCGKDIVLTPAFFVEEARLADR